MTLGWTALGWMTLGRSVLWRVVVMASALQRCEPGARLPPMVDEVADAGLTPRRDGVTPASAIRLNLLP